MNTLSQLSSNNARAEQSSLSVAVRYGCWLMTALGCAIAIFLWWSRASLWEDEIIAITHANQEMPRFFIEVLRNDIHPPFYFLQLDAWQALGLDTDSALLFNSLTWSFASLGIMFAVARARFGRDAAVAATALYAIMPLFGFGASNLRMYAMLPGLCLMTWFVNLHWFARRSNSALALAVALELVLAYSHAIEFYFVGFIVIAALAEHLVRNHQQSSAARKDSRRVPLQWLFAQIFVVICMLPLVVSALVRGSDASAPASLLDVVTQPGALVAGWTAGSILMLRLAGCVVFALLAAAGLRNKSTRIMTAVVPLGALAVAIAVSVAAKPMLKTPVFAANLMPFLVLGAGAAAAAAASLNGVWVRYSVIFCALSLSAGTLPLMRYAIITGAYADTADYLAKRARPGDVVVATNISVYWGIVRYAIGPAWGKPLEVMPLKNNPQWEKLIAKLGEPRATAWGLHPKTDHVVKNQVTYEVGEDARSTTVVSKRVWVVQRDGYIVDALLGAKYVRKSIERPMGGELMVSLYVQDPAGATLAQHPFRLPVAQRPTIPVTGP